MNCRLAGMAIVLVLGMQSFALTQEPRIVVIVNKANPTDSISLAELRRMFMKQTRNWNSGDAVVPVDWESTTEMRKSFSRKVLSRTVTEMTEFWVQQNVTAGVNPPSTQKSARAILRFVASVPGAISYVAGGDVDGSVKVLKVGGLQ